MTIASVSNMELESGSAQQQNQNKVVASGGKKKKRSNSPRVKIVGTKVYDSVNGKTCHQCRQKTKEFAVSCKNVNKGGKPCTIQVCESCLSGRYGEIAREVAQLDDWKCPKCRGSCNCSCCRKRRGEQPTGQLSLTARANGFKSVSDMLSAKAAAAKNLELNKVNDAAVLPSKEATVKKKQKQIAVSPMKQITSEKELVVLLPDELGKENSSDAKNCLKLEPLNTKKASSKTSKKMKRAELKEISNENDIDSSGKKKSLKRRKICEEANANDNTAVSSEVFEKETEVDSNCGTAWAANGISLDANKLFPGVGMSLKMGNIEDEIPLPLGSELTEIVDNKIPPECVGSALQFLEFSRTFGKVLDLKKGEPKAILREIVRKQNIRQGQNTLAVQFQIRVLTLILIDSGNESPSLTAAKGKNSWLKPLEDLVNESEEVLKDFPVNWLQEGIHGYHTLELSKKLTLLNFLCDEALGTETLRNFIDGQNSRHGEEMKEAKSKLAAAKEKEKCLRKNLQDEMAKVVLSNEVSLSMKKHDALLTRMKSDLAQAHAEVLNLKGTVPKGKYSDATRIEPEFLDSNGQVFWKLRGYNGDNAILLQDIKIQDETATSPDEKWFVYGAEKKDEVEKYISSRAKILNNQKVSDMLLQQSM